LSADVVTSRPRRIGLASVLQQLCSACHERIETATWHLLLPLAFVGKFDDEPSVKDAWTEVGT
jgi:hypothetical protein